METSIASYIPRRFVEELRGMGFGERAVKEVGGNTIEYQDHWIEFKPQEQGIDIIVEQGPKLKYLFDGIKRCLTDFGPRKGPRVITSRTVSEVDGRVVLSIGISDARVSDLDKVYQAVYRQGMKPIMFALQRIL